MHLANLLLSVAVSRLGELGIVLVERDPLFEVFTLFLLLLNLLKDGELCLQSLFGHHLRFQDFEELHFEI